MKTFKHRKTGEIAIYKDGVLKSSGFAVEIGIEPSNEFWEEVQQPKEYEILSFRSNNYKKYDVYSHSIVEKCGNKFKNILCSYSEEELLKGGEHCHIYSIKRLSDGEIFTIGDNVVNVAKETITKIKSFSTEPCSCTLGRLCVFYEDGSFDYFYDVQKSKPVLFTTEDGVDIFEGDEYFTLITPNFHNKPCIWNILHDKTRGNIIYDQEGNRKNGRIWFSTKEKAEEYVILNKPCLSIKDIQSIYISAKEGYQKNGNGIKYFEELKNLVKSKL